jgi:hypothetical protein
MSVNSGVENPRAANDLVGHRLEEASAARRERARASDTKAWLEGRLNEQTRSEMVMGREFDFRPIGTERVADVLDLVDGDMDDVSEMPTLLREMCSLLGEVCPDPVMDAQSFGQIPPDVVQRVFEDVAMPEDGADLDSEERERVDEFLSE